MLWKLHKEILIDRKLACMIIARSNHVINWLALAYLPAWLMHWLIDWLIDLLIEWVSEWLIDVLNGEMI